MQHGTSSSVVSRDAIELQVLPDNAYEPRRRDTADAAEPSGGGSDAAEFEQMGEPPIRGTSSPPRTSGGRKRVRFATYMPPQRRSSDGGEQGHAQVRVYRHCHSLHERLAVEFDFACLPGVAVLQRVWRTMLWPIVMLELQH